MQKFIPCPFCGSNELSICVKSDHNENSQYVFCKKCGCHGPLFSPHTFDVLQVSDENAIRLWNMRSVCGINKKDNYITLLSKVSNHNGDKLLDMMEHYGVNSLKEITEQQAEDFWNKLIN